MAEGWAGYPGPPIGHEAHHGDRIVRCFVERPGSLFAMFERSCAAVPTQDALVCEGRRWSYAQCAAEAERIAGGLAAKGVRAGRRVLMFIDNRPEFVFVLLALHRLGAIAVPFCVREQRPGLAYIARQSGAVAIVFDAALASRIPEAEDAPALALRVAVGSAGDDSLQALAEGDAVPPPVATAAEDDVALILYTSGTTGQPKGAMLTHLNIVHSVLHYEACMRLSGGERSALAVPASHVTGLIAIIATMLQVGGVIVVVPAFKAADFLRLVEAERISHTLMVPAMYNLCLLSGELGRHDLSHWRIGGYGGAPMPVATIDALAAELPGLTLLNAYGATETTSPTTMMPAGLTRAHADSVGIALPAADVRVMDDDGCEVPRGETRELWIGGPMVVPG